MTTTETRRCTVCERTMKPSRKSTIDAETIHQGRGMCTRDYTAWRRNLNKKPVEVVTPVEIAGYLTARRRRGVPANGLAVAS